MISRIWLRLGLLLLAAGVALGGLVPAASGQGGTIKIVSSLPRTGIFKAQTDSVVNAIRMGLEDAGSQAAGLAIVYEDLDDATPQRGTWDAAREAENAQRAAADPDVMVYIGTFNSGAAKVSIPILNAANLVMISPSNTYPGLTRPGQGLPGEPNIFYPTGVPTYTRVAPSDDLQGPIGAIWASELEARRVFVLDDGDQYGSSLARLFAASAGRLELEVVGGPESIDPKAADYRALAARVKTAAPDLVYFGGITQNNAAALFRDLRTALGDEVKLMGPDGIYEQAFLDAAGPAAEGAYITFGVVPPAKLIGRGAEWYAAYKARVGAEPEAYAAYGYEAMRVALDAIERAGTKDREAIRAAVLATRDYDGVLGRWSFDPNGDTTLTAMSGRRIMGGRFDDRNAVVLSADATPEAVPPVPPRTMATP